MSDTPRNQNPTSQKPDVQKPDVKNPADRPESPLEDKTKTPGDGTLQGATPAGMTSEELRRRAEENEGSMDPGTG